MPGMSPVSAAFATSLARSISSRQKSDTQPGRAVRKDRGDALTRAMRNASRMRRARSVLD